MQTKHILAVFTGGCLGGLSRYGLGLLLPGLVGVTLVNLVGSFCLPWLTYGLARRFDLPGWLLLGAGTGFIGALTTFSSLAVLTSTQWSASTLTLVAINLIGGLLLALVGTWCGLRQGGVDA